MKTNVTKKEVKLTVNDANYHLRKYKILEILEDNSVKVVRELKRDIPTLLNCTRQTFFGWCNLPIGSTRDIPAFKLFKLAKILGVDANKLINQAIKVEVPKSIKDKEEEKLEQITRLVN